LLTAKNDRDIDELLSIAQHEIDSRDNQILDIEDRLEQMQGA